jgi:hypothetical protein
MEKRDLLDWSVPTVRGEVRTDTSLTEYDGVNWYREVYDNNRLCIYWNNSRLEFYYAERNSLGEVINIYTHTGRKMVLASEGYRLEYCEGTYLYIAGCRVFTWRQALKHWNCSHYNPRRAKLFRETITAHLAEKSKFEKMIMLVKGKFYQWKSALKE